MDLQKFEDYLRTLDFDTLVRAWNEFCYNSDNGSADSIIYESVEDIHAQRIMDGFDIARALFFGSVESWNDRVYFNGYGNLESTWDLENSPIDISYLAKWLKDEDHEVYQKWIEDIIGEFSEHLAANVGTTELYKLWLEYEGEPDGDETMIDVFDIEVLADDLIKDNHQIFQDWLEEQEEDEISEDI